MDIDQTFEHFLESKSIDSKAFQSAEKQLFDEWKAIFQQVNPESFVQQKKFLINPIRRKYLLKKDA